MVVTNTEKVMHIMRYDLHVFEGDIKICRQMVVLPRGQLAHNAYCKHPELKQTNPVPSHRLKLQK